MFLKNETFNAPFLLNRIHKNMILHTGRDFAIKNREEILK